MTDEQWRPIPGFEGRYDVSDHGQVRSWLPWNNSPVPRLLTQHPDTDGYPIVGITNGRRQSTRTVHRLVMLAFVGPRPPGLETRHLDGDKLNNNWPGNLAYGTQSENAHDSVEHGTNRNIRKTHCPQDHLYDAENTYVTLKGDRRCRACARRAAAARRAQRLV